MKTKIIKIGNSRGIRIPKSFLDESGLKSEVVIEINDGKIIIKSHSKPREHWESAFQKRAKAGDDNLLDSKTLVKQSNWDKKEWGW